MDILETDLLLAFKLLNTHFQGESDQLLHFTISSWGPGGCLLSLAGTEDLQGISDFVKGPFKFDCKGTSRCKVLETGQAGVCCTLVKNTPKMLKFLHEQTFF